MDRRELIPSSTVISRGILDRASPKVKDSRANHEIAQLSGSRNERLKIAVDLDGVLAETMEAWCKHATSFWARISRLPISIPGRLGASSGLAENNSSSS